MKKITLLFICCLSVLSINATVYSGSCGDNVNYTLNLETGVLSITGTGAMADYSSDSSAPWYSYNSSIKTVNIADGVTSIGKNAFHGCSGMTSVTIPSSVTSIGYEAFRGCSGLTSITIGKGLTSIDKDVFLGCSGLQKVIVSDIAAWCDINFGNGYGNPLTFAKHLFSDENTEIKNLVIPNSVTSIGRSAFNGCTGLTSVTIPNSLTNIGNYAFSGCAGLTSIGFSNSVTSIGHYAFRRCTSLTSVTIPNSVTTIGKYAFYDCSGLTSVTIPNSVTSIGEQAFSGCTGLTSVTCEATSVPSTGSNVFDNVPQSSATLYVPEASVETYKATEPWSGFGTIQAVISGSCGTNVKYSLDTSTGLLSITGTGAMENYSSYSSVPWYSNRSYVKTVEISNSVTSIGNYAFYGCSGLTSITIPNSVTSIGAQAFYRCSGLKEVYCNAENIPTTSSNAFQNVNLTNATLIVPGSSVAAYKATSPWRGFRTIAGIYSGSCGTNVRYSLDTSTGLLSITGTGAMTNYGSPSSVPWYSKQSYVKTVEISNSVTSIGDRAFQYCSKLTSVTIPNSVTSIGDYAFSGCSGLTSVTIPNSVTSIGEAAFNDCTGLTSIEIPNSVTSIGERAFYNCSGLTQVTLNSNDIVSKSYSSSSTLGSIFGSQVKEYILGENVTSIGSNAFYNCSGLTEVTIGNSVTSIGNNAFNACSGLTSIEIPNSVTSIGSQAFYNCSGLTEVHITDIAAWCKISFSNGSANPLCYAKHKHLFMDGKEITDLEIPNSVTSIGNYAFNNCSGLTSIIIPNSVTSIGDYAFYYCSGLTSVSIGNSVTSIGSSAFHSCSGLTSITIPNSVTSIGNNAFFSCSALTKVTLNSNAIVSKSYSSSSSFSNIFGSQVKEYILGDNVTSIGNYAFYNCKGLTSVTIPNSVKSIGNYAFNGCSGLTSVTIPNSVTSIGGSAFSSCSGLTSVTIPNSVTSIGERAFSFCGLTSIEIPNSVTSIGERAFAGCSGLASISVESGNENYDSRNNCNAIIETASNTLIAGCKNTTIPNSVKSIGNYAFNGCSGLTSIEIPNSVKSIGNYAFYGCSGLTSVTIPNSVTSIGERAFYGCSGLTSVTIGNSVTSIGNYAFYSCSGLTKVTLNSNAIASKTYSSSSTLGSIFGSQVKEYVLGDDVTSIGDGAFYGCSGLTSVTIPNSVTGIGTSAFSGCSGLTSITIGNSVTSIGGYAFYNCSGLTSITIPNSVTSIEGYAFYNCSGLTSITIGNSVTSIGNYAFRGCSSLTSVTIGNSVTSIGQEAFSGCSGLTLVHITDIAAWCKITFENIFSNPLYYAHHLFMNGKEITDLVIPNSVTSIGNYAFRDCSNLTSVTIPDSVTSIGNSAFYNCSKLTSVTIGNSVTSIGSYAFYCCSGLTSVTIGNSVTSIGGYAFYNCSGLTSITIPNSVTSIGGGAFAGCTGLTSIEIPNSVTSIGNSAFSGCSGLTSVTIPNSVTSIGNYAFSDCRGLTSIEIPNSVTSIGSYAFYNCSGLKEVKSDISVPFTFGSDAFSNISSNCVLVVPYGTKDAYIAKGWTTSVFKGGIKEMTYVVDGIYYDFNSNNKQATVIAGENKYSGNVIIPSSVTFNDTEYSVTSIGNSAFYGCEGLTSVTIPNSVTSIGYNAFTGCNCLTSIEIPRSLTSIGSSAFENCSSLTSVHITDLAQWCKISFNGSDSNPLSYAHHLYMNGKEIKDLVIPYSVTSIGEYAFYKCSGLRSISISSNVDSIRDYAFANIPRLEKVYCYAKNIPKTEDSAFKDAYIDFVTLYVPESSFSEYKATSPWSGFEAIFALPEILRGDANGDGKVDMDDATFVTNIILGTEGATEAADVNNDGKINIQDVMFIINYIKNGKFPDEVKPIYYYYAGWTLPTASNIETIIDETWPADFGSTTTNNCGKKTTNESPMDFSSNTLYNADAKTYYYVLVPNGQTIVDPEDNASVLEDFTLQGTITVGNQTHTIYKSNITTRYINAIKIY